MPDQNSLLGTLPPEELRRLRPHLEPISLVKGRALFEPGEPFDRALFPTDGIISLLAVTPSDKAIELAMVGREGVVGLPLLFGGTSMPYEALVQVAGTALTIAADVLRAEFNRARRLHQLLLGYERRLHAQLSRAVLCHRFHNLSSRIGRWLLNASDRLGSDTIEVTQEALAYVLNAPRTAVNAAAVNLCDSGTIRYRHGRIVISDRAALSRAACQCYRAADRRVEAARSAS